METGRGSAWAVVAAVFYGVQYAPLKAFPVFDGSKFQFYMSTGIAFVGLIAAWTGTSDEIVVYHAGLRGGALYAVSNVLVLPTVKFLGLGVGFAGYHAVNMIFGYSIGRFGLFGVDRDAPSVSAFGL